MHVRMCNVCRKYALLSEMLRCLSSHLYEKIKSNHNNPCFTGKINAFLYVEKGSEGQGTIKEQDFTQLSLSGIDNNSISGQKIITNSRLFRVV